MTFDELVTAVGDRGFAHVSTARRGRWVNTAVWELHGMARWPFLEKSVTGTAPLTVSDLGTVEQVTDETNDLVLQHAPWQTLNDWYGDLTTTGTPVWFYVAWPSGVPVVATYPVGTVTIGVQYWKVTAELSGSNTPAAPTRFHSIYEDIAVREGYADSDNSAAAGQLQARINEKVAQMADQLFTAQTAGPDNYQQITGASVDG